MAIQRALALGLVASGQHRPYPEPPFWVALTVVEAMLREFRLWVAEVFHDATREFTTTTPLMHAQRSVSAVCGTTVPTGWRMSMAVLSRVAGS